MIIARVKSSRFCKRQDRHNNAQSSPPYAALHRPTPSYAVSSPEIRDQIVLASLHAFRYFGHRLSVRIVVESTRRESPLFTSLCRCHCNSISHDHPNFPVHFCRMATAASNIRIRLVYYEITPNASTKTLSPPPAPDHHN